VAPLFLDAAHLRAAAQHARGLLLSTPHPDSLARRTPRPSPLLGAALHAARARDAMRPCRSTSKSP
jgi:hypothetical protein